MLQSHSLLKEPMNNIIASCSEIHQTNKNWNKPLLEQNDNKKGLNVLTQPSLTWDTYTTKCTTNLLFTPLLCCTIEAMSARLWKFSPFMEPNCKMRSPTFKPYKRESKDWPVCHLPNSSQQQHKKRTVRSKVNTWNRILTAWNDGDALATESTLRKAFSLVEISENISMAMSKSVHW